MKSSIKIKGKLRKYIYMPMMLTILLVMFNGALYIKDLSVGAMFSVFIIFYVVVLLLFYRKYRPKLAQEMVNFATQYGTVQKKLLSEFEIPYTLLDYNAKIMWCNEQFMKVTGINKDYHKSISAILPSLTKEIIQKTTPVDSMNMTLEERNYRVSMRRLYFEELTEGSGILDGSESSEYLTAVYLFDETEINRYIKENREQKLVAGLVYIDNYEEALDSIEDVKRSLLVALIDRKVNKYFSEIDALVRKIEKDKYFVVFRYKYLEQLKADKFSLIEDVKTVKVGNEMAVTLSIGLGAEGAGYNQNYEYARMSIDLALGRGGDQVVLKEGEEVSYYGGKTQQVEKNTRVKARVKAHALREIIESREHVVIMGHNISDVDSLGAAIGVYCAARELGKKAQIVLNEVTASLRPLVECFSQEKGYPADLFINSEEALLITNKNTLVMVVDTNRPSYTECPDLLKRSNTICVFDHHRQGSEVIENPVLSYIEPYASSACEMIAEVLQYFGQNIQLESAEADCIYAGILIDTNNFNTKTGVRTFEAAAYLRRAGADMTRVRKMLREDMSAYKARAEAVRHAEVYKGIFAISICPAEGLESPTVVGAQAANELLNIVGVKASFVITEYNGKIYVSARSIDEINVQVIMEKMGGGGHLNVAGCQFKDCTVMQAKNMIQDTLSRMISEGDIDL
ncbi:MAG: DHH family phosphoesterase [Lachnospiraceae bacterium]|nr:DHH family phosphoesterase [Lachnospiraceae bacterium]